MPVPGGGQVQSLLPPRVNVVAGALMAAVEQERLKDPQMYTVPQSDQVCLGESES